MTLFLKPVILDAAVHIRGIKSAGGGKRRKFGASALGASQCGKGIGKKLEGLFGHLLVCCV